MKENKKEDLLSRREFFKKTARKTLPIMAVAAFGTSFLASCDFDEPDGGGSSSSGSGCSGSCKGKCDSTCKYKCTGGCKTGCLGVRSGTGGHM